MIIRILALLFLALHVAGSPVNDRKTIGELAQNIDNSRYIDANNVLMFATNHGNFGQDLSGALFSTSGTFFPFTSFDDITSDRNYCVYGAGLWVSGKVGNETRVAVARYGGTFDEYVPGPMDNGTFMPDDPSYRVYKLFADSLAGNPNQDYLDWPTNQGAPTDAFGIPKMVGDQTLWSVYNDANPSQHSDDLGSTAPLGVEIRHAVFAGLAGDVHDNVVFHRYRIFNKGASDIDSCFISMWFDPDIGQDSDDLAGCDTARDLAYAYNFNDPDARYDGSPPSVGFRLLQGPMVYTGGGSDSAAAWGIRHGGFQNLGMTGFGYRVKGNEPGNAEGTYNWIQALDNDGSPYAHEGDTLAFMSSGNPVTGMGDLDLQPMDINCLMSTGPISLASGDSTELYFAEVFGKAGSRLQSVTEMKSNSDLAMAIYENGFAGGPVWYVSLTGNDESGLGTEASPLRTVQEAIDRANANDTIIVMPGAYTESIHINKGLTLRGYDAAQITSLQAELNQRVITVEDSPDTVRFADLDISGGSPDGSSHDGRGGGILAVNSAIVMDRCNIYNNQSVAVVGSSGGGGIAAYLGAYFIIRDCLIHHNVGDDGGGILASTGSTGGKLTGSMIYSNTASDAGGGIFLFNTVEVGTFFDLTGNTIVNNSSDRGGFGLQTYKVDLNLERSIIAFNQANPGADCAGWAGLSIAYTDSTNSSVSCSDIYGNCDGYDYILPADLSLDADVFFSDPLFCDAATSNFQIFDTSPCAASLSPCGSLIGALEVACQKSLELQVSKASHSFFGVECGGNPAAQVNNISVSDGSSVLWNVVSKSAWLTVTPASGSTPQQLSVAANISGLNPGPTLGSLVIHSPSAVEDIAIPVQVTVEADVPSLSVYPSSLSFSAQQGDTDPVCKNLDLVFTGCDPNVSWIIQGVTDPWLSINTTGVGSTTLPVCVDPTGMPAGTYDQTIQVHPAVGQSQTIPFSFSISGTTLDSLVINPVDTTLALGENLQLSVLGYYADGGVLDRSDLVQWQSTQTQIATVGALGMVTSLQIGSTDIIASLEGRADTTSVVVEPPRPIELSISPESSTVALGQTVLFEATAKLTDGNDSSMSESVSWISTDTDVATVNSAGLAEPQDTGSVQIIAQYDGQLHGILADTAQLQVVIAQLTELMLTGDFSKIWQGDSVLLDVYGKFSNQPNNEPIPRASCTWSAVPPNLVEINTGWVKGLLPGTAQIIAERDGLADTFRIEVNAWELDSIAMECDSIWIVDGRTVELEAYGYYTNQGQRDLTDSVYWNSLTPTTATADGGVVNGNSAGTTFIKISLDDEAYVDSCLAIVRPQMVDAHNPDSVACGSGITLRVHSSEQLDSVSLHHRMGGTSDYSVLAMVPISATEYEVTLMPDDIGLSGLQYYFSATDNGVENWLPLDDDKVIRPYDLRVKFPCTSPEADLVPMVHNLIGFPLELDTPLASILLPEILGPFHPGSWRLGRWVSTGSEGVSGYYVEYPDIDVIERGQGYWLISAKDVDLRLSGLSPLPDSFVNDTGYTVLRLAPGLNQIASPFPFEIDWRSIVETGNHVFRQTDDCLWEYHPVEDDYTTTNILAPFGGGFVRNSHATDTMEVLIPYLQAQDTVTCTHDGFTGDADSWTALIRIQGANGYTDQLRLGVHPEAKTGIDDFDYVKPDPMRRARCAFFTGTDDVGLNHPLHGDYRAPSDTGWSWIVNLDPHTTPAAMISIEDSSLLPEDILITVMDGNGRPLGELRQAGRLSLAGRSRVAERLILRVSSGIHSSDAPSQVIPTVFVLRQNHPNPFNAQTVIGYDLPQSAEVVLEVFNVLGQKVATLVNARQSAGSYESTWDGLTDQREPAASGLYIYQIRADQHTVSKKMVLMK